MQFERYWIFALCCIVVVGLLVRLLLRERVSLQHSLAFLLFMLGALVAALSPLTSRLGRLMGFELPSNFFFAILIGVLVLLHLGTVIALSRLESRTIALTQELGLVQEQVARLSGVAPHRGGASESAAHVQSSEAALVAGRTDSPAPSGASST